MVLGLVVPACSFNSDRPDDVIDAAFPDGPPRSLGGTDGYCEGEAGRPRVLVYTFENMWRHQSNLTARGLVYAMCETRGFTVTTTNDPHAINATRLADADVVVFAVTSGNGLDAASKAELEAWIRAGGGVVGLEAASATEMDWPFFVDNLGAAFAGHAPGLQRATVRVDPAPHPITDGLPVSFVVTEQWYVFDRRPEEVPGLQILLALDESTLPADFPDEYRRGYHAIGWAQERFGGRTFYTGLGDNPEGFENATQVELIGRAIEWAARAR
jgi:type 1 glutamine amidotransferase